MILRAVAWVWLLIVAVFLGLFLVGCVYAFIKSAPAMFIVIAALLAIAFITDWAFSKVTE